MKKKILSLAILVSVLIMSIPQTVYAEWENGTTEVTVYIGQTLDDSLLAESDTGNIGFSTGYTKVPTDLDYKSDGGKAYLYGKVSDENEIPGKYKITIQEKIIYEDGSSSYGNSKEIKITVKKGSYSITGVPASINKKLDEGSFKLEPTAKDKSNDEISDGTYSYKSSDTSVATVDSDGNVTINGIGKTQITVTFEKNDKYEGSGLTVTLTVTDNTSPSTPDSDQNTDNDNHSSKHDSHSKTETVEAPNPFVVYLQSQASKIKNAKAGDTVIIESKSDLSLPLEFMKELQERKDITRKLSYNYKGLHYEITIPKGQAFVLDDTIPWYGPLKLSAMFGAEITPIK